MNYMCPPFKRFVVHVFYMNTVAVVTPVYEGESCQPSKQQLLDNWWVTNFHQAAVLGCQLNTTLLIINNHQTKKQHRFFFWMMCPLAMEPIYPQHIRLRGQKNTTKVRYLKW